MILTVKEKYEYVPRFGGNDKLPEAERFRCEIIRPSPEEIERLTSLEVTREYSKREVEGAKKTDKADGDKPRATSMRFLRHQDTGRILREHVGKCWNLSEEVIGEDGRKTRRPVNSGAELADSKAFGIKGLVDELCAEVLRDEIEEEEEKNSE